jgi:transcriptional regulator with XRE-family HTH domain
MPQVKKINAITERFIAIHKHLKDIGELPDVKTLSEIIGYKSYSIISDILARRANIRPDAFNEFKGSFRACIPDELLSDNPALITTFGMNLRLVREFMGKSQTEFGEMVGASKTMIQSYEAGRASPKRIISEQIAQVTGIPFECLENRDLTLAAIKDFTQKSATPIQQPTALPATNLFVISEADLRRLITECVNDALKQFMMKAAS